MVLGGHTELSGHQTYSDISIGHWKQTLMILGPNEVCSPYLHGTDGRAPGTVQRGTHGALGH